MSTKLDEILDKAEIESIVADSLGVPLTYASEAKQQIKDLVLRLVDDIYSPTYQNDQMATDMWHKISNRIKEL